jgi:hypothetical protein
MFGMLEGDEVTWNFPWNLHSGQEVLSTSNFGCSNARLQDIFFGIPHPILLTKFGEVLLVKVRSRCSTSHVYDKCIKPHSKWSLVPTIFLEI